MKLTSTLGPLLLGLCLVSQSLGFAVNQERPLKFLVLQKSDIDILEDATVTTQPDGENGVTEGDDVEVTTEVVEIVTENVVSDSTDEGAVQPVEVVEIYDKKSLIPADRWKELNFPVLPEEGDVANVSASANVALKEPELDLSNVNITRGYFSGRAACQCGKPKARIVNGESARINDIPWTVALVRNGFFGWGASKKPYCGGTLINDLYVATASHCVDGMFANMIKVWLNEENFLIDTESDGPRQEYQVDEIIMHEDYSRKNVNNDIALLKLSKPVPIDGNPSTFITPACLPANNDNDFSGITGTVAGWGVIEEGGPQSASLRKVDVPIISNENCNSNETKYSGKITENMLCAGFPEGQKDACQGDSGGPLIIDNAGRKTLVGIVSWGFGCAKPMAPGVYSRVGRYSGWILQNTKGASWCSE